MNMSWFDRCVGWFFPRILLSGTPWLASWEQQEREAFNSTVRIFFPFTAVVYIAHYFFFDLPMKLEPLDSWFQFRMATAGVCIATTAAYYSSYQNSKHYKLLAAIVFAYFCFSQARVTVNFGQEAWIFCFAIIGITVQVLREPLATSLLFSAVLIGLVAPSLVEAKVPPEYISSAALLTFILVFALRSTYRKDVDNFILNKENLAKQEQLVELNRDFTDRIRSFIPTVISKRIESFVSQKRMSVIEASIEVLRAQEKTVSCLFSDIRGFTQNSRDLDSYIAESVIPEMRVCSNIIEQNQGIPRKIGDLVFAYFDHDKSNLNILRSVLSGIEISIANKAMNTTLNKKQVDRYILISTGEAVVGNIGGVDSSVEITALGSPVNYLSRLDEVTKTDSFKNEVVFGDVIVCERTFQTISELGIILDHKKLELSKMSLSIRDFIETADVYVIKPSRANQDILRSEIKEAEEFESHDKQSRFRKIA